MTRHEHIFGSFVAAPRDGSDREWIIAQCSCGARTAILEQARERDAWEGEIPPEIAEQVYAYT